MLDATDKVKIQNVVSNFTFTPSMLSSIKKRLELYISFMKTYISAMRSCLRPVIMLIFLVIVVIAASAFFRKPLRLPNLVPVYEENTYTAILNEYYNGSLLNPHPFKYVHLPSNVCTTNNNVSHPEILILVKSDATHFSYRMGIRSTWGNISLGTSKLVFLLGYSSQIQTLVDAEYKQFHDIVQEDFNEAYRNNTIKTIMAFNWAVKTCPGSRFLLFVNDDYFVNVNAVLEFLKENGHSHLIAGFKMSKTHGLRNIDSKWFTKESTYLYYPPYISGGAMLFSMTAAMIVQHTFPYVKAIPLDDAYIGIVAYLLNLSLTHDERFLLEYVEENVDICLAAHDYGSPDRLIHDWRLFLRRNKDHISVLYQHQMHDILN